MNLEYNSSREKLLIPEYGRHVQKMLQYAQTVEPKEQRQMLVEMVIRLMEQMQTQTRPSKELTDKLWNHAFMIGEYKLNVDAPEDVVIVEHQGYEPPPRLEYPHIESKFRHYGFNVQQLIDKAIAMEDEEKKALFMTAIGSYMKLAYKTWNREHYVSDEVIKSDLKSMSNGKLIIAEDVPLDFLSYSPPPINQHRHKKKRSQNGSKRGKGGHHRGRKKR